MPGAIDEGALTIRVIGVPGDQDLQIVLRPAVSVNILALHGADEDAE